MMCTSGGRRELIPSRRANASSRALDAKRSARRLLRLPRWDENEKDRERTARGKGEERWNEKWRALEARTWERSWNKAHSTCRRSFLIQVACPTYSISIRCFFLTFAVGILAYAICPFPIILSHSRNINFAHFDCPFCRALSWTRACFNAKQINIAVKSLGTCLGTRVPFHKS